MNSHGVGTGTTLKYTVFYDPHRKGFGKMTKALAEELGMALGNSVSCWPTPQIEGYDLSHLDIVVADTQSRKVKVLCEIEEWGGSVAPKVVVGDVLSTLLSDRVKIKGKVYTYEDSHLILGLPTDERAEELGKMIQEKFRSVSQNLPFEIVFGKNMDQLKSNLKKRILKILE